MSTSVTEAIPMVTTPTNASPIVANPTVAMPASTFSASILVTMPELAEKSVSVEKPETDRLVIAALTVSD